MKRISIALMTLAAALAAVSCQKVAEFLEPSSIQMTITALSEQITTPGTTKAEMAYKYDVLWQENDSIRVFSNAVVTNNVDYNYGDQISFIWVEQLVDPITGYPRCKFHGEYVVLDKTSEVTLRSLVSEIGFSVMSGNLACSLGDSFQGAYAWVHSRKGEGHTLVSSQVLVVRNTLYDEYSTEEAYQRAVATYGGESDSFLTPEDQQVPNLRRSDDV